jgi:hypothetical protein
MTIMSNGAAPSCPISYSQIGSTFREQLAAYPKPGVIKDLVNKIPRAHDLPSVITALNAINNIVTLVTRSAPQVNNTFVQGSPSIVLKGEDFNPHYAREDWVQESREYATQKLKNPDDEEQFIEIKTVKVNIFFNTNDSSRLFYDGPTKWGL